MTKEAHPSSILITFTGNTTHALKVNNTETEAKGTAAAAACGPRDRFSEYEGARIALARLYGVDPFPEEKVDLRSKFNAPIFKPLPDGADVVWARSTSKPSPHCKDFKVGDIVRVAKPIIANGYTKGDVGVVVGFGNLDLVVTFSEKARNRCVYAEEVKRIGHREKLKDLFAALTEDYEVEPHLANAVVNLLQEVSKHE